jgi:hypothetical protein
MPGSMTGTRRSLTHESDHEPGQSGVEDGYYDPTVTDRGTSWGERRDHEIEAGYREAPPGWTVPVAVGSPRANTAAPKGMLSGVSVA